MSRITVVFALPAFTHRIVAELNHRAAADFLRDRVGRREARPACRWRPNCAAADHPTTWNAKSPTKTACEAQRLDIGLLTSPQALFDAGPVCRGRDMMFRVGLLIAACAGLLILSPAAEAQYGGYYGGGDPGPALVPGPGPGPGPGPEYGDPGYGYDPAAHCARMQDRMHEIRYRMEYADPWERERMAAHAEDLRDRLRAECWHRF
jgi:hypothetical protein